MNVNQRWGWQYQVTLAWIRRFAWFASVLVVITLRISETRTCAQSAGDTAENQKMDESLHGLLSKARIRISAIVQWGVLLLRAALS